jgi:hypothetical protein
MSELALSAVDVGELVTYVAPGYVAQLGYQARFPRPPRPAGELLIVSVVISLPLVALVDALLSGQQGPTQVGHLALLLTGSAVLGYLLALLRGSRPARGFLLRLGYLYVPEGTIYAETLKQMKPEGTIVVELKDGRRVAGCPRSGPQLKDDGINELYLVYPEAEDHEMQWSSAGEGLIVPLSEVSTIVLSEEPTGAPPRTPVGRHL